MELECVAVDISGFGYGTRKSYATSDCGSLRPCVEAGFESGLEEVGDICWREGVALGRSRKRNVPKGEGSDKPGCWRIVRILLCRAYVQTLQVFVTNATEMA